MTQLPFLRTLLRTLFAATLPALALPSAVMAQATCPSGAELLNFERIPCARLRHCTQADVAVRINTAYGRKGSGTIMFGALERYRYCTQGRGSWSEQQWVDKCTQQGWKVVRRYSPLTTTLPGFALPAGVDLNTTPYCVLHKTNPRYRVYFDGNGFLYQHNQCDQDRDNNGSYETRVSGSPNCSPAGPSPTQVPKWVAPWD